MKIEGMPPEVVAAIEKLHPVTLLPCPFCGSAAKLYCETVTCSNPSCKMHFAAVPNMHTPEEWNERSDLYLWRQLEDARGEREKARRTLAQIREGIANEEENGLWDADTILSIIDTELGPPAEYRLLSGTDTIQADDEFLTDDCQTWARVGDEALKFMIGKPYSATFFQPMRRRTSVVVTPSKKDDSTLAEVIKRITGRIASIEVGERVKVTNRDGNTCTVERETWRGSLVEINNRVVGAPIDHLKFLSENVRVVAPPPVESEGVEIEMLKGGCPPTSC